MQVNPQTSLENMKTAFKVEEYAQIKKSESELMEEILETKAVMESLFERSGRNFRTNTWDEMES